MSNTTATPRKTRRPSTATMRSALVKRGTHTKDEAAALAPAALLVAFEAPTPEPTPAPVKTAKAPAKGKTAPAKPAPVKKTPANCGCGCGAPTITEKASFLPGHDARFAGLVGRGEVVPSDAQTALITPALAKKIDGIRATATKKAAVKAAREAGKAAAKAAFEAAMA